MLYEVITKFRGESGAGALGGGRRRLGLFHAVLLAEPLDATGGIDQLLLPGEERMTLGADFDVHGFLRRRPRFHDVTAGADDLGIRITSYNVCYTKLLRRTDAAPERRS